MPTGKIWHTRYSRAGWGECVKIPADKAATRPIAYPESAYQMYLCPLEDCISKGLADTFPFLWSKQRTNAKSIEGIACQVRKIDYVSKFVKYGSRWNRAKLKSEKWLLQNYFANLESSMKTQVIFNVLTFVWTTGKTPTKIT